MSAWLSWLLLVGLFLTSLLWAEKIGQVCDWVLDRMGWGREE